jgi:hypothetical protein
MSKKIERAERLPYEVIQENKVQGRELCGYLRNPMLRGFGTCALDGERCLTMYEDCHNCPRCVQYFRER